MKNFAARLISQTDFCGGNARCWPRYRVTIIHPPPPFCTFNRQTRINWKFIFRIDGRNSAMPVYSFSKFPPLRISLLPLFLGHKSPDKLNDFVISGGKILDGGKMARNAETRQNVQQWYPLIR